MQILPWLTICSRFLLLESHSWGWPSPCHDVRSSWHRCPWEYIPFFLLTISVFWKVIGRQIKFSIFFHCLKATRFTAVAVWLELLRTHTSAKGKYLYIHCLHRCTSQPILFWQPTVAKEAKARKAAKAMILERRTNLHLVPAYTSSSSFQHARAAFWPLREGSAPHGWFFSDFKSFQLSSWNGFETY